MLHAAAYTAIYHPEFGGFPLGLEISSLLTDADFSGVSAQLHLPSVPQGIGGKLWQAGQGFWKNEGGTVWFGRQNQYVWGAPLHDHQTMDQALNAFSVTIRVNSRDATHPVMIIPHWFTDAGVAVVLPVVRGATGNTTRIDIPVLLQFPR